MAGEMEAESSSSCGGQGQGCGSCAPRNEVEKLHGVPSCIKCKQGIAAKVVANQTEPLCQACLHQSLLLKFKTAVTKCGLVNASERLLVAFSGGPGSRVALEFLLHLRAKAQRDADGSKEHKLAIFDVGVAFVDESILLRIPETESVRNREDIRVAVASAADQLIPLHIEPLGSALAIESGCTVSEDYEDGEDVDRKLLALFDSITDETGKQDLQELLRMLVLQKVARTHGYAKVVLGLSTSRIAAHVMASIAKGRGFCLPADIQYVDSRYHVPVVVPLRDCVARELVLHCHFAKLKTVFIKKPSASLDKRSINDLCHSFLAMIQEENPAREHTVVRTASKLRPFEFNNALVTTLSKPLRRQRQEFVDFKDDSLNGSETSASCPLCQAPLDTRDYPAMLGDAGQNLTVSTGHSGSIASPAHVFRSRCCPSCQYQFLSEDNLSSTYQLLPHPLKYQDCCTSGYNRRWIRSQIEEYLIGDG